MPTYQRAARGVTILVPSGTARAADSTTETGPFHIYPLYLFWRAINVGSKYLYLYNINAAQGATRLVQSETAVDRFDY